MRAYEGEVESLTSADSSGVGIRVLVDGATTGDGSRVGFAWAGRLDPDVIAATLADARDNARFATPDPDVVLAAPDGVAAVELDLWDDGVAATPMEKKVALALDLERATRAADPRVRQVSSADYSDSRVEVALASTTGISSYRRRTNAFLVRGRHRRRGRRHADRHAASASAVVRAIWSRRKRWTTPSCAPRGCSGAQKARSTHCTVVFDPRVVSTLLGVISSALSGEAVVKGRSFFAGRIGETVAAPSITLVDDPTDTRAYGAASHDGEGLACRRNVLIADGMLRMFVFDTVSARRAGTASTGSAVRGGFAGTPSAGCRALVLTPGDEGPRRDPGHGRRRALRPVGHRGPLGREPRQRRLLGRGRGPDDPRRARWPQPVREVTVASTLQRMLQSVVEIGADLRWLPGVAAGQTLAIADMALERRLISWLVDAAGSGVADRTSPSSTESVARADSRCPCRRSPRRLAVCSPPRPSDFVGGRARPACPFEPLAAAARESVL